MDESALTTELSDLRDTRVARNQRNQMDSDSRTQSEPQVRSSDVVLREQVRAAIEAEEELDGEMPDHVYARLLISKRAAEELLRAAVRATKQGIKTRLGL